MAATTSYRLFSKDRDVFYDGTGPQRDYTVTIPGDTGYQVSQPNAERLVNVTWGADVQPALNGRYLIVNRNSGKVLEVPGGGTGNGVQLDQNTYTHALYQQWDVNPLPSTFGGDYSYFAEQILKTTRLPAGHWEHVAVSKTATWRSFIPTGWSQPRTRSPSHPPLSIRC